MNWKKEVVTAALLFFVLFFGIFTLHRGCACGVAEASGPLEAASKTERIVEIFTYRDGALRPSDPRHKLVGEIARAIDTSAELYGLDPALLAACTYAESSMDPRAVGASHGETGLLQVHGQARRRCRVAGLDLDDPTDQIYCGSQWLAHLSTHCGQVVKNHERCIRERSPEACAGGLAAFISGACRPSKSVARKVGYRYRLRRWVLRQVDHGSTS